MKKLALTAIAILAAGQAFASGSGVIPTPPSTPVPEISAMEGTAALAAVAAVLLLVWERRRRAS